MIKSTSVKKKAVAKKKHSYSRLRNKKMRQSDFSDIEDSADSSTIIASLGRSAGLAAAAEAKAAGLSVVYATEGNKLVEYYPDGRSEALEPVSKVEEYFVKYPQRLVLNVKK